MYVRNPSFNPSAPARGRGGWRGLGAPAGFLAEPQPAPEACPGYLTSEVQTSHSEPGHLPVDVLPVAQGLLIADFGVDWRHVRASTRAEPLLRSWQDDRDREAASGIAYEIRVVGYSDCVGRGAAGERNNLHLRRGRARRVFDLLRPSVRGHVVFQGPASMGTYFTGNGTPEERAKNRSVVLELTRSVSFPPEQVQTGSCTRPNNATTFHEFVSLVMCVERAYPHLDPRQILSLMRQLYYGTTGWSRTTHRAWSDVITCGVPMSDPRSTLGTGLYTALRNSQVVQGTDLGHVFTGLEAMCCPRTSVELEIPGPNWTVSMPNAEFATWGGDIGSAAAQKVRDEADLGRGPQPWSNYFLTSGSLASLEDLNGDIDAFAIRRGITGAPCSSATPITTLPGPVSQILHEYYTPESTPIGSMRAQRIACVIEAMGGTISGRAITNRSVIETRVSNRVFSFAEAFYKLKWHGGYFAPGGIGSWLRRCSREVTERFIGWLEGQL